METHPRKYGPYGLARRGVPWWFYVVLLAGFYLLGWALRYAGIIPAP